VIDLAREVSDYCETELPKWHRDYPLVNPDEGNPPRLRRKRNCGRSSRRSLARCSINSCGSCTSSEDFGTEDLAGRYEDLNDGFAKPASAGVGEFLVLAEPRLEGADSQCKLRVVGTGGGQGDEMPEGDWCAPEAEFPGRGGRRLP
jgi:hypothetical protein